MRLHHLIDIVTAIVADEAPQGLAARIERRIRRELATGRRCPAPETTKPPTVTEVLRELPRHRHRLAATADALGISEAELRKVWAID